MRYLKATHFSLVSSDHNELTDNHCHLPDDLNEASQVVEDAKELGVHRLIDVGTSVIRSAQCISRAEQLDGVRATAGVHPHDAKDGIEGLEELLPHPKTVAVGECGLDYYYDHSPRDIQRAVFAQQIQLAHQFKLPLVIHTRDAWSDTFDLVDKDTSEDCFHCFTGGPDEATAALERGAYLSFSGIVTFQLPELRAALTPSIATWLKPMPRTSHRFPKGKQNRPGWVTLVGEGVAEAGRTT